MEQTINGRTINGPCACACGHPVNSPTSRFRPGHDQRWVGQTANEILAAKASTDDIRLFRAEAHLKTQSGALQAKVWNKVEKAWPKILKQAKAKQTRMQPAADEFGGQSTEEIKPLTVKIGRWTYPLSHDAKGFPVRNTKRDGSGEWVALEMPARIEVAA